MMDRSEVFWDTTIIALQDGEENKLRKSLTDGASWKCFSQDGQEGVEYKKRKEKKLRDSSESIWRHCVYMSTLLLIEDFTAFKTNPKTSDKSLLSSINVWDAFYFILLFFFFWDSQPLQISLVCPFSWILFK